MAKNEIDLVKLFGVEGMVTVKTLVTETSKDVNKKSPNDAAEDIRALLDSLNVKVCSNDIEGVLTVLAAIQLRLDYLKNVAEQIKKSLGK